MDDRKYGVCRGCQRRMLVREESGLCVVCENEALRAEIDRLNLVVSACRREKLAVYERLIEEREIRRGKKEAL